MSITNAKLAAYLVIAQKQQKRALENIEKQFGAEIAATARRDLAELEVLILDLQRAHPDAPQMASASLSMLTPEVTADAPPTKK